MLTFRPLELADQQLVNRCMKNHGYSHSDASFANLYIWKDAWNTQIAWDDRAVYIQMFGIAYGGFLLPPYLYDLRDNLSASLDKLEEYVHCDNRIDGIRFVPEILKKKIEADCPGRYRFIEDPDNADYIYKTEDLMLLEGKKYHAKRNHINRFLEEYEYEYIPYSPELKNTCLALQEEWAQERAEDYIEAQEEFQAVKHALHHCDELNLKGCVLTVNGKASAFSFGERLSQDTALIHIEKAYTDIDGIYQFINREFLKREWSDTVFVNREEDMGLEGLRRAKQSYNPVRMEKRYRLVKMYE